MFALFCSSDTKHSHKLLASWFRVWGMHIICMILINYNWLHLMYVMAEILKVKGENNYKNPHRGNKKMDRLGHLPTYVEVVDELLNDTVSFLNEDIVEGAVPMWDDMVLEPEG